MSKSYLINLEDGEDGEVILPFPSEMLTELGWNEGDTLDWTDNKDGTFSIKKIEPAMQWVLVETVNTFRNRYMIQTPIGIDAYGANKADWALDTFTMNEAEDFSQEHIGEQIISHRVVSEAEALKMCDVDNDYASEWSDKKKIEVFFTKFKAEVEHFPIPN